MEEVKEKSKIELIKEFFETCPLLKRGKISVDYLDGDIDSYSIDKTPSNPIIKQYRDGGVIKQITFDFTVQAPISSNTIDNLVNSKFCEDFMKWIEKQNKQRILPNVPGIQSIKCTSPGYILQKTETQAVYIIQMNCQYYEPF